jgi:hypothetical protein
VSDNPLHYEPADFDGADLDGAALLDDLHDEFTRFVVLPSAEAADAVTLWDAATHGQPAWEHATRLAATSPQKRCGKSRLLDIIEATCHKPLMTVNISAAALARSVRDDPPTLLLDEADTVFGNGIKGDEKAEILRGLINAGHQRNRPYIRWDAIRREPENCPTFAMAALAGIRTLPDTITDRAVNIRMQRRAPGERVQPFRVHRDTPPLHKLRDLLASWVRAHLDGLRDAEPVMPVEDRAADNWAPLVAVADLAGSDWPDRARRAAKALTGDDDPGASLSLRLLSDLRDLRWGEDGRLPTRAILAKLHEAEESPWASYGRPPRPLDGRGLAQLLRDYGVHSHVLRVDGTNARTYDRADLESAWQRYLSSAGDAKQAQQRSIAGQTAPPRYAATDTDVAAKHDQGADQDCYAATSATDTPPVRPCPLCDDEHERCEFRAGSAGCVKPGCTNPHHREPDDGPEPLF